MIWRLVEQKQDNFVQFSRATVSFGETGSYSIVGENRDSHCMNSNAAGKSLLLDALTWCPYGRTLRGTAPDRVVGPLKEWCSVTQLWRDGDREMRLARYRNHPRHKHRLVVQTRTGGGEWSGDDSKETVRETDAYVAKLLGVDYETFRTNHRVVKAGDEENFCHAGDARRKEIFSRILDLGWLDRALDAAKADLIPTRAAVERLESDAVSLRADLKSATEAVKLYREERKQWRWRNEGQIATARAAMKREGAEVTEKEIAEAEANELDLKQTWNAAHKLETRQRKLEKELSAYEGETRAMDHQLRRDKETRDGLKHRLGQARDKKGMREICTQCGSPYTAANAGKLVAQLEQEWKRACASVEKLEFRLMNAATRIAKLRQDMKDTRTEQTKSIHDRIVAASALVENLRYRRERWLGEDKRIAELEKHVAELEKQRNPYGRKLRDKKRERRSIRKLLLKLEGQLAEKRRAEEDLVYATQAFGNSGMRNDIISGKLDEFEARVNGFLSSITDGDIYVRLDNKVQHGAVERIGILIQDGKKSQPLRFEEWSGGERTRISFAFELAKHSLLDSRVDLLLVDEGFDDMDPTGAKRVVELMKAYGKRILCISNRPDMQHLFGRRVRVVLEGGSSTAAVE